MIRPNLLSQKVLHHLEKDLVKDLRNFYGERLLGAALFGSVVKGTLGIFSDIDLFLLIKTELPPRKRLEEFEKYLGEKLEEKYGFFFSSQILSPEDLKKARSLGLALLESGKILYDPEGLLQGWLEKFREGMERGEIERLSWQGKTYWRFKV